MFEAVIAAGFAARMLPNGNIRVSMPSMNSEPVLGVIDMSGVEPTIMVGSMSTNVSYTEGGTRAETSGFSTDYVKYRGISQVVKYFTDNFSE